MKKIWVMDPHSGGKKIPEAEKPVIQRRILAYAEEHYAGKFRSIDIRFKGAFCYIDAYEEPYVDPKQAFTNTGETPEQYIERLRSIPTHLCRLRYFGLERWNVAFYTYSHEQYERSFFNTGKWIGTLEEGFEVGAIYLN
jgi:hypothetical protein